MIFCTVKILFSWWWEEEEISALNDDWEVVMSFICKLHASLTVGGKWMHTPNNISLNQRGDCLLQVGEKTEPGEVL